MKYDIDIFFVVIYLFMIFMVSVCIFLIFVLVINFMRYVVFVSFFFLLVEYFCRGIMVYNCLFFVNFKLKECFYNGIVF